MKIEDNSESLVNVSFYSILYPSRILPPCFYNGHLSENLKDIYELYSDNDILKDNFVLSDKKIINFNGYIDQTTRVKKGVEPINFISEKPSHGTRKFSVAHPLVQLPLHKYILDNVDIILNEQIEDKKNYSSNSKYYYKDKEIYVEYDYNGHELISSGNDTLLQKKYRDSILKKHILSRGKFNKLYLDIANFYHNIYTHTISWNIDDDNKDIFDNLDMLMRTQNNNETKGIIIGPYTSGLFAEILMSKIDRHILKFINDNNMDVSYARYVDDIEMYSDNKDNLEKCLFEIEKELSKFKLDINHNKTQICEFPFFQSNTKNTKNIYQLVDRLKANNYQDDLEKIEDIILEFENAIKDGHVNARYFIKVINSLIKEEDIIDLIESDIIWILVSYLINITLKHQYLTPNIIMFLITIVENNNNIDKEYLAENIINKRNIKESTTREIVDIWFVYILIRLNIKGDIVNKYFYELLDNSVMCSVMILNYYYYNDYYENSEIKGKLKTYFEKIKSNLINKYGTNWLNAAWLSKYWIIFYMNETRWKIHEIVGYKDTVFEKIKLDKLLEDPTLMKKLNIFKIMKDLGIEIFDNDIKE